MTLQRLIPLSWRHRLRQAQRWILEAPERSRIRRRRFEVPAGRPAVIVAADLPRDPGAVVRGGRVKLYSLEKAFPGTPERFNILYVLSSALPGTASTWIAWASSGGARVVWNQDGVGYPGWAGPHHEETNRPMRRLIPRADMVLYQSRFCQESAEKFLGPVARRSRIVHNAVDTRTLTPLAPALPAEPLVLLMAGSHQASYRVEAGLRCLSLLRRRGHDVRLVLAGPLDFPDAAGWIERTIRELELDPAVEIAGPYPRSRAVEIYQKGQILVHPQYKDACPSVVLEAMSCGLPVVGSRSGGMPELVGDGGAGGGGGGVLVDVPESWDRCHAPDPGLLADAVEDLARRLPEASHQARNRAVDIFDETRWLAIHESIFQEVLESPVPAR